ncbi:MAG TPA: WecB/TagA/CpsF family glycosyltransferase [Candidatus Gracilibacteria bacterium]
MAKLGIDARFCTDKATGIGKHVSELIAHLALLDKTNEYVVFLNPDIYEKFQVPNAQFQKKKTTAKHYSLAEQTLFLCQINREKFDLMIFPQFNAPVLYKRPFVVTIHDLTLHKFPGKKKTDWLSRRAYKYIIRSVTHHAAHCFAVSENTKKDMIEILGLPPEKITVTLNGVSQRFNPAPNSGPDLNAYSRARTEVLEKYHLPESYFLYTGVMRDHKNIMGMIKAYKQFLDGNKLQGLKNIPSLVIAGPQDKIYFKEIIELCKQLALPYFSQNHTPHPIPPTPGIHFPGFIGEDDINTIMVGARAFVFPSFYEGFGIPPLEAMQCGVPTITSSSSSLPEVCGDATLYFDPNHIEQIAECMQQINTDQVLRTRLRTRGFSQCQKFSWEAMAQKMLKQYQAILDKFGTITILDVPIARLTRAQAVEQFLAFPHTPKLCATPNAEILLKSQKDPALLGVLQTSSINYADSVSLLWAGQCINAQYSVFRSLLELIFLPIRKPFWHETFPQIVSGSDLYLDICRECERSDISVFLLGGQGQVPQTNAKNLQKLFPKLRIAGYLEGNPNKKFDQESVKEINKSKAEILFVAFGCPYQELWLKRNLPLLQTVKVGMGIGGSFDFVAGTIRRAPRLIRKAGLEWLWRLLCQPSRWKRIFDATVIFPYKFLQWRQKELKNLRT